MWDVCVGLAQRWLDLLLCSVPRQVHGHQFCFIDWKGTFITVATVLYYRHVLYYLLKLTFLLVCEEMGFTMALSYIYISTHCSYSSLHSSLLSFPPSPPFPFPLPFLASAFMIYTYFLCHPVLVSSLFRTFPFLL